MTEEEKLEDSLAAWVPPWQRVTTPPASTDTATPDTATPDTAPSDTVAPDTADRDGDGADEIVDSLADLAYAPSTDSAVADIDDEDHPDGLDEDDYLDVDAAGDGGDDDDEPQRPETDVITEVVSDGDEDSDDEDDDEPQRPETDVLTEAVADFGRFAYPSAKKSENEERAGSGANRPDDLRGAVEAIMLVLDEPVAEDVLAGVLDVTTAEVAAELATLAADYNESRRGFELRRAAGGWRLYTRGEFSAYVERFVLDGQSVRLTQAALETLAVVAYQQPVTRSRMAAIRGVNCDGVVRTLVSRGLIEECGTQPESGAFLYKTTQLFLEKLGLDTLEQLPALAPFLPDDVNGLMDAER